MTPRDDAAIASARLQRPIRAADLGDDTGFVIKVLDWLLTERAGGRLRTGAPVTFVWYDFSKPGARNLGSQIDLTNGKASYGSIHLCPENFRSAYVLPGGSLVTPSAHQVAIVQKQLAGDTSLSFDPATGEVQIRLACVPHTGPISMQLGDDLSPAWVGDGLAALPGAIEAFHASLTRDHGLGSLFFDDDRPSSRARIYYRNAMFLFLQYQLGLRHKNGYRVTPRRCEVVVTQSGSGKVSVVTSVAVGEDESSVADAVMTRLFEEATAAHRQEHAETHISCLCCTIRRPAGEECAVPPISLRHRHIEAA